jgi:hypothetical protein
VAAGPGRRAGRWLDALLGRRPVEGDEAFPSRLESVAAWVAAHYRNRRYPAVVIGEPHGAAVHLAAALGAAWLPTTVQLRTVGLRSGRRSGRDGDVDVPGAEERRLPDAYRDLIGRQLRPGASLVLVGVPQGDVRRELADLGRAASLAVHDLAYDHPTALSAAVADLYRQWLRRSGKTGNRLVIESNRLIDPGHVVRAGLVPYWCPRPTRTEVDLLQQWIAGSQPFTSIEALPEAPGTVTADLAPPTSWAAAVAFAQRRGVVDPQCRRAYPLGSVPRGHATTVLSGHPYDLPPPPPLNPARAIDTLRDTQVRVVPVS